MLVSNWLQQDTTSKYAYVEQYNKINDMEIKANCSDCNKGIRHYHKIEYKTDFWQPTERDKICYCGKTWGHFHYDHKLQLIIEKKIIKK